MKLLLEIATRLQGGLGVHVKALYNAYILVIFSTMPEFNGSKCSVCSRGYNMSPTYAGKTHSPKHRDFLTE